MQKVGILGGSSRVFAAIAAALANVPQELLNPVGRDSRQRRGRVVRRAGYSHRLAQVKTSWPGQTEAQRQQRLDAAEAKRKERGIKRTINAQRSFSNNFAHLPAAERVGDISRNRFIPFI